MAGSNCERCLMRSRYDRSPRSLIGRFWRWHINWCPGWRRYVRSLPADERHRLAERYDMPRLR